MRNNVEIWKRINRGTITMHHSFGNENRMDIHRVYNSIPFEDLKHLRHETVMEPSLPSDARMKYNGIVELMLFTSCPASITKTRDCSD